MAPRSYRCGSEALYQRQLRASRLALGLCRLCTRKAANGYRTCAAHLAYLKAWKQNRKAAA